MTLTRLQHLFTVGSLFFVGFNLGGKRGRIYLPATDSWPGILPITLTARSDAGGFVFIPDTAPA